MSRSTLTGFLLNTGATIPAVGLGTWKSKPSPVTAAVSHALLIADVRHIDCAWLYGNEVGVGRGLQQAFDNGIRREDVFVTSKLWCTFQSTRDRVQEGVDISLQNLGLEYLDLYLMHWPLAMNANGNNTIFPTLPDGKRDIDTRRDFVQTYKDMEQLIASGKVKAIGVSNFSIIYLKKLLAEVDIVPAVNQVELHVLLPQLDVIEFCKSQGILVTAYSPFGSTGAPVLQNNLVIALASKYKVEPGTIVLSYLGVSVVPKSVTLARIERNSIIIVLRKGRFVITRQRPQNIWQHSLSQTKIRHWLSILLSRFWIPGLAPIDQRCDIPEHTSYILRSLL